MIARAYSVFRNAKGQRLSEREVWTGETDSLRDALARAYEVLRTCAEANPLIDSISTTVTGGGDAINSTDYVDELHVSASGLMNEIDPSMLDGAGDITYAAVDALGLEPETKTKEVAAPASGTFREGGSPGVAKPGRVLHSEGRGVGIIGPRGVDPRYQGSDLLGDLKRGVEEHQKHGRTVTKILMTPECMKQFMAQVGGSGRSTHYVLGVPVLEHSDPDMPPFQLEVQRKRGTWTRDADILQDMRDAAKLVKEYTGLKPKVNIVFDSKADIRQRWVERVLTQKGWQKKILAKFND